MKLGDMLKESMGATALGDGGLMQIDDLNLDKDIVKEMGRRANDDIG